jgi:hypothetical protein
MDDKQLQRLREMAQQAESDASLHAKTAPETFSLGWHKGYAAGLRRAVSVMEGR